MSMRFLREEYCGRDSPRSQRERGIVHKLQMSKNTNINENGDGDYWGEEVVERALRAVETLEWKILTSSSVSERRGAMDSGER